MKPSYFKTCLNFSLKLRRSKSTCQLLRTVSTTVVMAAAMFFAVHRCVWMSFTTWTGVSLPFQSSLPWRLYFQALSLPSRRKFDSLRLAEGKFRKAHASFASCYSCNTSSCRGWLSFRNVLGSVYGFSQLTISRCIKNATSTLCRKMELFISFAYCSRANEISLPLDIVLLQLEQEPLEAENLIFFFRSDILVGWRKIYSQTE